MKRLSILSFILAILLLAPAYGSSTESEIDFYIEYGKVLVEYTWFLAEGNHSIDLVLPSDARSITAKADESDLEFELDGTILSLELTDVSEAKVSYITDELLEKQTLIASISVPVDTDSLIVRVSLPEDSLLAKPLSKSTVSSSAVYPNPTRLETNGRVIDIIWEHGSLSAGEELSFLAKFVTPGRFNFPLLILILLAFVTVLVVQGVNYRKQKGKESIRETTQNSKAGVVDVSEHLKDDEAQIVEILKMKEGSCEQGTLRVITGFSKATLSRLLKELEDRKIVHKEKRGKKNLVFLKKQ